MKLLRPVSRRVSRPLSWLVIVLWLANMGLLLRGLRALPVALAADLARFGGNAQWKGVYYRGAKIGFMVGETRPLDDGYELEEQGQLQMVLLGSGSSASLRTLARVDRAFGLRSFRFSLDPGSGAIVVEGRLDGRRLLLSISTPAGQRSEERELAEPPALSLNLPRRLAAAGLAPGTRLEVMTFDPATLRNAPMTVAVHAREVVWSMGRPVPAFKVETAFAGVTSLSWITDVGEVVREESPMGMVVVRETRERAAVVAVPQDVQHDMLEAAAVVPTGQRIVDATQLRRLKLRIQGPDLAGLDLQGAGQTVEGDLLEIESPDASAAAAPPGSDLEAYTRPEPLLESDDPGIAKEARTAVQGVLAPRARAERLVRHVHALLEKRPTISIPSAREVLRTRVGDCNEHTALYVAMARSLALPARIAVGLVYLRGAFYYHAWPEVWIAATPARGYWMAVDPTFNQFPADVSHVRLARGGLDRQAAILPLIGHTRLHVVDAELRPGVDPVLVGAAQTQAPALSFDVPRRSGGGPGCWSRPGS